MYRTFQIINNEIEDRDSDDSYAQMLKIYQTFVDTIIPRTLRLASEHGSIQYYGALDSHTDEYLILTLNNYYIPLAKPIAMLIDLVARRIIYAEGKSQLLQYPEFYYGELFSALSINDRLHALTILENRDEITILDDIPEEYQIENQGLAISTINTLNRHTLMGYYSEWSGYGSTRLNSPNNRTLEFKPISWDQIGYPGPSLGYRAQYKVY